MEILPLTGLLPEEITALLPKRKEKYRGMQIFRWIHQHCARTFDEMTNLPKSFREAAAGAFTIGAVEEVEVLTSADRSTDKFLWRLGDGCHVESVVIRDQGRITACISSQVGCRMGCAFCRTGGMGFIRDLTAGEIVDQVISMKRSLSSRGEDITNIVFMGMGEPLDNIEAVAKAVIILTMETSFGIGQRKITISTCGIVPGIQRLPGIYKRLGLAVSFNAADNDLRNTLMPVNRKYPIEALLEACRGFTRATRRRVTFEYILIAGVNDSPEHARKLLAIARNVPSKVNLIAFNEFEGSHFRRPSDDTVERFQRILFDGNITAMIRKSKGTDICAACGQLAVKQSG